MTCLTVSNTIHPISAPTGTDADMGGNDKRKPSDVNDAGGFSRGFDALSSCTPTLQVRVPHFMTSPGLECTTAIFEKHRVWPKGKCGQLAQTLHPGGAEEGLIGPGVRLPLGAGLQSLAQRI